MITECHHPGCSVAIDPEVFACRHHWIELPPLMRERVATATDQAEAHAARLQAIAYWRGETADAEIREARRG